MYSEFSNDIKPMVSTLVSDFDRKKVAYELKNTRRKASGNLDMGRLAFYKTTDQIFKKKSVKPEGKSHGLYVLVDWSGSMRPRVVSAVRQTIALAKFAKKAGIDFSAYIFVGHDTHRNIEHTRAGSLYKNNRLIEVLNTNTSNQTFENACKTFYNMSVVAGAQSPTQISRELGCDWDIAYKSYQELYGSGLGLSNTPLSSSMISAYQTLSKRVNTKRIQNPNFVLISDGDCTGMDITNHDGSRQYTSRTFQGQDLIDPETSKVLPTSDRFGEYHDYYRVVGAMMSKFKSKGFKTTTFYITHKNSITCSPNFNSIYCSYSKDNDIADDEIKSNKKRNIQGISYIKNFAGCDNYYYISDKVMNQSKERDVEDGKDYSEATAAQLSKALMNKAGDKTTRRFLASMLAEQIAEVYTS